MSSSNYYYCGSPGGTGQQGPPGETGPAGATGPNGETGNNGSITTFGSMKVKGTTNFNGVPQHIDPDFNVWWYVGGGWNKVANIIGPDGNVGATGATGGMGSTGGTGGTGQTGPKGVCRVGNNINMVRITNNGTNSIISTILYPYLYLNPSSYLHTLKVSYKIQYQNDSNSIQNWTLIVYNQANTPIIKFIVNVPANSIGVDSNLDMVAGLNNSYYYCSWFVSNPDLHLTLNNICLRTIN